MKHLLTIAMLALPLSGYATRGGKGEIKAVAPVSVTTTEGHAPMLPYRLWTTYNGGRAEYRQVRWNGALLSEERAMADATRHPAGTSYTVEGYITGDNTTSQGYPVVATVTVTADRQPAPHIKAHTLPLNAVSLTGTGRLASNRDLALREICSWDVTQQLYNYRDTYALPTQGYTRSEGWDSPDTKLKGHGSGHYMSALAQAYAVTDSKEQKTLLFNNIKRMVDELRLCQEKTMVWCDSLGRYWEARDFCPEEELRTIGGTWADFDEYKKHPELYGYGYLNAIPAQHAALIEMYRPYNNTDWVWAPYYTIHKQLAGLLDIATLVDDKEVADKALLVAKDMGLWVWNRMHYRTYVSDSGTQDERRRRPGNRYEMWNMYIAGEVGGIGESLARMAEMVSDPVEKDRLLEAAMCFDSPAFFEPLKRGIDDIRTRHANQHIPMIIAALRSYNGNNDRAYYDLASNFWHLIQGRYRYATGGVGNGEMFRQPYTQVLSMATNGVGAGESVANPDLNETCCAYNLLKLTRDLNCYDPDNAAYMDYYERTLYNQIVGSLNPHRYATTYQYALGINASKPWGNETPHSTCCGGTGSENHTKYQEAAYFVGDGTLWVALYMPTTMVWKEQGVSLEQQCVWPADRTRLVVKEGHGEFTMKLRVPYWATEGFTVKVNGKRVKAKAMPGSYLALDKRVWQTGDVVEVHMPFAKHLDYGPDKLPAELAAADGAPASDAWVATLMYGPLAMTAGDVVNWNEAALAVNNSLSNVKVIPTTGGASGTDSHVHQLSVDGRIFQPDYYRSEHSTHYFRIGNDATVKPVDVAAERTRLQGMVDMALQRKAEQERWMLMEVKVPEFAPWARNGYERMLKALNTASELKGLDDAEASRKIASAVASLNVALNTMRPGNLAELEELYPLEGLLRRAGNVNEQSPKPLRDAVDYALMVKKYVGDGSGTSDMIQTAIRRLKEALQ